MTRRETVISGRNCDGCTLCCKLLSVEELEKPPGLICPNCRADSASGCGCGIYPHRPTECRGFFCEYLLDPALGAEWRPATSNIVVSSQDYSNSIVIHVDADEPTAWRADPYLSQIEQWAAAGAGSETRVIVWQGDTKFMIAPGGLRPSLPNPEQP